MTSSPATGYRLSSDQGIALIVTLMAMSLMLALGLALTLTTMTELRIAASYRRGAEGRYAAYGAMARAVLELSRESRWDEVLSGARKSTFVDGAAAGVRILPRGGSLDVQQATNAVRCGRSACSPADFVAITDDRPWGRNNPIWQPYAYGPLEMLAAPGALDSAMYVMVWVGDDPSENDDDPLRDGGPPPGCDVEAEPSCADSNIGRGVIVLLARAFGPDGTQRTVVVTLARNAGLAGRDPRSGPASDPGSGPVSSDTPPGGAAAQPTTRVISWRESR